ncbi:hypothetical protein [Litorimonas sp.]|uniref:hypothetical protein n=1 Tax=Litorimonas sp. TaxID=1892381 RepID=UPI003A86DE06
MTLPTLEGFAQHLEELLTRDQKAFARKCREVWNKSAKEMADDLALHGYHISEGKCLYIRNATRTIPNRDVKAIEYIMERKALILEAQSIDAEIAEAEAFLARKRALKASL